MMLSKALIAAGKPFEQAIHPGPKHGFRGPHSRHFYERMTEFFDRHLGLGPKTTNSDQLKVTGPAPPAKPEPTPVARITATNAPPSHRVISAFPPATAT